MTAAAIATLGLDGTDAAPPPLTELLARVAGRVALLIEVKTEGPRAAAICLAVRRALEGYRGPVAVMGFNPEVSRWFACHAPRIVRGLVIEERAGMFDPIRRRLAVRRARPEFLAYDLRALPSRLPAALRRHGLPVLTWTVRTPAQRRVAARHADRPIFERGGRA